MNTGISGAVTSITNPESQSMGRTTSRMASGISAVSVMAGR
jgi:hypothetical protein